MKQRCTYQKHQAYKRYGGAGITIDPRWLDFMAFLKDMGERPDGTTLERKDGRLGYYKDNCQWATRAAQARNTKKNLRVTYKGQTKCISEWAKDLGIKMTTLRWRFMHGWKIDAAFSPENKSGILHRSKTHCPSGHEYTPENTCIGPNGHRKCRTCNKIRAQKLRDRLKAAQNTP